MRAVNFACLFNGSNINNVALRRFLNKFKYQHSPFPVSLDVIDEFYAATPDSLDYIEDRMAIS